MEFDAEYNEYLSMTAEQRIDAAYEAWLEAQYDGREYAEASADADAMEYA